RRHTRFSRDWSSDVCSSDLKKQKGLLRVLQPPLRAAFVALDTWPATSTENQRCYEQHQEDHEQDLGDTCRSTRDTTEPKDGSNDCNNQESNGPTQHGVTPLQV